MEYMYPGHKKNNRYIAWGLAGFSKVHWHHLYGRIREFNIKSILEYGPGLSTELLMALELDLLSIETSDKFPDIPGAEIIMWDYNELPKLKIDRRFDLGFVDGPGGQEFGPRPQSPERKQSVIHAKKYCDYIFMHDNKLQQMKVLDDDPEWERVSDPKADKCIFYKRKK